MCGIFGTYIFSDQNICVDELNAMSRVIRHRGPDADGIFMTEKAAIGNRRLAILDLDKRSDQPVYSDDGNTVLVQNGEIYNYVELKAKLLALGYSFRTEGDTEVILNAYLEWGDEFVHMLNGMFAIAIYEPNQKRLKLFRDRLGVKPLYIAGNKEHGQIWFGSEIKAILQSNRRYEPNLDAVCQYLALNYVPAPYTMFEGIYHVMPGHFMVVDANGVSTKKYWDLNSVAPEPDMSPAEAKASIISLLDDATRVRMRADAKFGAFLSGGLDSSSVVGFMSMYADEPIRTYSIGFSDKNYDETIYANMTSERFGTNHRSRIVEHDLAKSWAHYIWHCDQAHGDVSFMPMSEVSRLASEDVKMVLTGDGADELFGGYEKYLDVFPHGQLPNLTDDWAAEYVVNSGLLIGDEADQLICGDLKSAFEQNNPYRTLLDAIRSNKHQDQINQLLLAETKTLLPGNNLVKPDRMAMAHSLEVRSPYLDYRMAELAFRIPGTMKLNGGVTKSILKDALKPLLGDELTYRKKQMFTVPVGNWFRQALVGFCRDMFFDGRLENRQIINVETLEQMLAAHITGERNYTRQLRALISLEIWFRLFVDGDELQQTQPLV